MSFASSTAAPGQPRTYLDPSAATEHGSPRLLGQSVPQLSAPAACGRGPSAAAISKATLAALHACDQCRNAFNRVRSRERHSRINLRATGADSLAVSRTDAAIRTLTPREHQSLCVTTYGHRRRAIPCRSVCWPSPIGIVARTVPNRGFCAGLLRLESAAGRVQSRPSCCLSPAPASQRQCSRRVSLCDTEGSHWVGAGALLTTARCGTRPVRLAPLTLLLRQEPPHGKLQHVCVAACAVIGGHEVVADH